MTLKQAEHLKKGTKVTLATNGKQMTVLDTKDGPSWHGERIIEVLLDDNIWHWHKSLRHDTQ